MKVIEKVASKLSDNEHGIPIWDELVADMETDGAAREAVEYWRDVAEAAIEALGIIVLPKDAEPEEGDYVAVDVYDNESDMFIYYECGYVDGYGNIVDNPYNQNHIGWEATDVDKIILRDNKPVIYEEE